MLQNFIFRSQIGVSNKNLFTYVILITPYERFSANNHLINQQTPREPKLSQIYQRYETPHKDLTRLKLIKCRPQEDVVIS